MSSQGPIFVGSGTDGTSQWVNPGNVTAEDGATASITLPNTQYIRCTMGANLFSIPNGNSVTGILVEIKSSGSDSFGGTVTYDKVQLTCSGGSLGTNQASSHAVAGTLTWDSFGGPGNVFGTSSLTVAQVNDSTFGVDIAFADSGTGPGSVGIDAVRITVYYGPAGDAIVFNFRKRLQRDMGQILKQNQSAEPILFFMADSTDHVTGKTGLSPVVKIGKNGAAGSAPSGAVSQVDSTNLPGWYQVAGNATDCNTLGPLLLYATATGADPWEDRHQVVAFDPRDVVRMGQTALPNVVIGNNGALPTVDSNLRVAADAKAINGSAAAAATLQAMYSGAVLTGTVNAVTTNGDFTLTSTALLANDNEYNGMWLVFTSGSNAGVPRLIGTYTGATKRTQFNGSGLRAAFPETVSGGDAFAILAAAI